MSPKASAIRAYRGATLAAITCLLLFFGLTLTLLPEKFRELATAQGDVTPWSISQLDTEFANLDAVLARRLADTGTTEAEVRLRIDITLSRLAIVTGGKSALLLRYDAQAGPSLDALSAAGARISDIVDGTETLSRRDLATLSRTVSAARPLARTIALLGVEASARRTEDSRDGVLWALTVTGSIVSALLLLLAALVLVLNRLLARAVDRDEELNRSSERLQSTIEASLDAIVTTDNRGRIRAFNAAAEKVFDQPRTEVIGKPFLSTLLPPTGDGIAETGIEALIRAIPHRSEIFALRKGGVPFPAELKVTPVEGRDGTEYVAYIRDVSLQREAQQRLIDARDRAEQTDTAKSRFLAVMSHEMRTPLNGILGVLDLLRTTPLERRQARYVEIANASSEILLERVNEALDITRIETGSLVLDPKPFAVPPLLEAVAEVLAPLASEKALMVDVVAAPEAAHWFLGDAGRIRQILINLVGNAVKFTDEGGVTIRADWAEETGLELSVTDTGKGIAPKDQARIFEDFVTIGRPDGRQNRGDGLGLSISRRVARQMGGDLTVTSTLGQGTCFVLALPLPPAEQPDEPPTEDTTPIGGPKSVLVVEDNDINRSILRHMLSGMGHRVVEAADGAEALLRVEAERFDLILMDINMPILDGIAATRQIRAGGGLNAGTPIIALTAHGQEEYRARAEAAGVNGYQTKPLRLRVLTGLLSETPDMPTETDSDNLRELCAMLGPDRVQATAGKLFEEVRALVDSLPTAERADLIRGAHQAKGAAAMLGLSQLERTLACFETLVRDDAVTAQHGTRLRAVTDAEDKRLAEALTTIRRGGGTPQAARG